jgi:hypothetical protein
MSLDELRRRYPWPNDKPAVEPNPGGWCDGDAIALLGRYLSPETTLVMELGTWLGLSARHILGLAPHATLICADHWKGSPEHQGRSPEFEQLLPKLWETFCVNMWYMRDRVVPMRADVVAAMREVAQLGLQPDVIWIDADHEKMAVVAHMTIALDLFPEADVLGHDHCWDSVREAVDHIVNLYGLKDRFRHNYTSWAIERRA